jgi:uncharacterized membrane protein YczE
MGHARAVLSLPRLAGSWSLRGRRLPRRLLQLYAGLALYAVSMAFLLRSTLGNMPWDVLHQGLAERTGWSIGRITIVVGTLVLLSWIPLRQRPGLGTVSNVVVIGLVVDGALAVVPAPAAPAWRVVLLVAGLLLNALATAAYIGVDLGPGPRDGLMTGLVRRTGGSVRLVRTSIEVAVVLTGWALGGTLGIGTVLYAVAIGPLVQVLLPWVSVTRPTGPEPPTVEAPAAVSPAPRPTPPADAPPPPG